MPYKLFDYQLEMKARLWAAFGSCGSVMCQMPTGTGKTRLLAAVVSDYLRSGRGGEVWIVAHRRELVSQIEETLERLGLRGSPAYGESRLRVFSIQWLSRNWARLEGQEPGLVVIDEAHHSLAMTYRELWAHFPNAMKLGMTATPCRLNGGGFRGLFDRLVSSWSISEFIRRGRLSPFDYISITRDSREQRLVDSLRKRGADGDYQTGEMNSVLNRRHEIERLGESVERYAGGKKGIVYAISIEHARSIAEHYRSLGMGAVAIDSRTPASERKRYVEMFRRGEIRTLVNVDVFSEGFDCPDVEYIQLARPTLSLAKYLQQVGRGLRLSEGKEACVLIDNVGLCRTFGMPVRHWDWEAMFEGTLAGKGLTATRRRGSIALQAEPLRGEETVSGDDGFEVVVTHERLLEVIREEDERWSWSADMPLTAYSDEETGLCGLRRGGRRVTEARYEKVRGIRCGYALVRYPNMRLGVVNGATGEERRLDGCCSAELLEGGLLRVTGKRGETSYMDLRNGRWYGSLPRVVRFGSMELLEEGDRLHSRTREPYSTGLGVGRKSVIEREYYLELHEQSVPSASPGVGNGGCGVYSVRCVLEGDSERVYTLCHRLTDGSIVVTDGEGRLYHVEKGGKKRQITANEAGQGATVTRISEQKLLQLPPASGRRKTAILPPAR